MVLLELQEIVDVCVPRLDVHRKSTLAFAATINVARSLVERAQHGDNTVAMPVGTTDVSALRPHARDSNTDATSTLGDLRTLLQGVIDAVDTIRLHRQQEA